MASLTPFGKPMRQHFLFADSYIPLNHGSFGSFPREVKDVLEKIREQQEQRIDRFLFYDFDALQTESRGLAAKLLNAATEEVVFVPNASTGINTVMRNLIFEEGDVILTYEPVYGAVANMASYLAETTPAESEVLRVQWPIGDDELVQEWEKLILKISEESNGKRRVKLGIFDTILSQPGARAPFERLTEVSKKHNVLTLIDGSHGIGHIPINLGKLQPDFFVSNLHKWLFVPRGCAALYVPLRHQHLIRSSLPTSHGYRSLSSVELAVANPIPPNGSSAFVEVFNFVGTLDTVNYYCVRAALDFRNSVCGGEAKIMEYVNGIAKEGGKEVARILGTEVMDNPEKTMSNCAFATVRLPLKIGTGEGEIPEEKKNLVTPWVKVEAVKKDTYPACVLYAGNFWWRLSGQVYLELEDFVRGAEILKEVCQRVRNGEAWS